MFVLGVDPGLSRCGYGIIHAEGRHQRALAAGVIRTSPENTIPQRLFELQKEFSALMDEYPLDVVAIERVLFQNNVSTAIGVGQASGIVMAQGFERDCEIIEYSPNEIKLAVAGDGSADKQQMSTMVKMLLGLNVELKPVDAADALGVALCHLAYAGAVL